MLHLEKMRNIADRILAISEGKDITVNMAVAAMFQDLVETETINVPKVDQVPGPFLAGIYKELNVICDTQMKFNDLRILNTEGNVLIDLAEEGISHMDII